MCLLNTGGRNSVTGLSLLCVLPFFWLAWSGAARRLAGLLSSVLVAWMPLIITCQTELRDLAAPMLIPFIMLAIFGTVATVERDSLEQCRQVRAAEAELQESLRESRRSSALLSAVLDTVDVGGLALDATGRTILMNNRQRLNHALAGLSGDRDPDGDAPIFGLDQVTQLAHALSPRKPSIKHVHPPQLS